MSYDRILQLTTDAGNAVIEAVDNKRVVCPTVMQEDLFTLGILTHRS